jgi:two-component system, NtrC family, sensor kinase
MTTKSSHSGTPEPPEVSSAERALLQRPSFGIRSRLALGFLSLFLMAAAITAAAWIMLSRLEVRLKFLEVADRYTLEIQQARRFEKNYFLYGTNLQDVQEHMANARNLLGSSESDAFKVLTASDLRRMRDHLDRYEALIQSLAEMERHPSPDNPGRRVAVESELRAHGSQMVAFALELAQKERSSVNQTLALFKRLPVIFLVVLLLLVAFIVNFLARQMLGPLTRLVATAQRIATGDFTPITPARRYRDEFSDLAVALNTMMREVAHRQDVLVQSHKLQAVGTLTAGVAHELNNPINNIILTAEMLREDFPTLTDSEKLEMVDDLVDQGTRAQRIVRNLLDFARESEIRTERLDVGDLLRDTANLAANQVKLSGAKILLEVPQNLPPIHGDRQSISQVFLNLILNSLDAVGKGGHVWIKAEAARAPGYLQVTVSDDGKGIPSHLLPYIFDPFFTTKSKGKGTGLGLSVSLGIVRQHGGDIRASSLAGRRTEMLVVLPAARVPDLGPPRADPGGRADKTPG